MCLPDPRIVRLFYFLIPSPVHSPPMSAGGAEATGWVCGSEGEAVLCLPGALDLLRQPEGERTLWESL